MLVLGLPVAVEAQGSAPLELAEAWSVALQEGVRVRRIAADASPRILLQDGAKVLLAGPTGTRLVGNFDVLEIVGMALRDSTLLLVDARTRREVSAGLDGRVATWRPLSPMPAGAIVDAARTRCGWVIAMDHGDGRGSLAVLDEGVPPSRRPIDFRPSAVTASGNWATATESTAPYRIVAVDCADPDSVREYRRPAHGDDAGKWVALPAFVTGDRVVQTLVDLESDRKRYALFGLADRSLIRETELDSPLTLVAPGCRGEIVALRRTATLELSVFREPGASPAGDCPPPRL